LALATLYETHRASRVAQTGGTVLLDPQLVTHADETAIGLDTIFNSLSVPNIWFGQHETKCSCQTMSAVPLHADQFSEKADIVN
jgi:hypothetical protein